MMSWLCSSADEDFFLTTFPACGGFPWMGLSEQDASLIRGTLPGKLQMLLKNRASISASSSISSLPFPSLTSGMDLTYALSPQRHVVSSWWVGGWLFSSPSFPTLPPSPIPNKKVQRLCSFLPFCKKPFTSDTIWFTTCHRSGFPRNWKLIFFVIIVPVFLIIYFNTWPESGAEMWNGLTFTDSSGCYNKCKKRGKC